MRVTGSLSSGGGNRGKAADALRFARRLAARVSVFLIALVMVAGFAGYLDYWLEVNRLSPERVPEAADGIVVLTGGADRVATGIRLLEEGKGKRLLISGVHPSVSRAAILRVANRRGSPVSCCIDLDRLAPDTHGNADEAARWARKNGFSSLIVVSSAYHLPRGMVEFRAAMPDISLAAYPAVPESEASAVSQASLDPSLRTGLREYAKYLGAKLRVVFPGLAQAVYRYLPRSQQADIQP
jgi:uncharacterized SAM-binding protein YcdF (DUF218 family)